MEQAIEAENALISGASADWRHTALSENIGQVSIFYFLHCTFFSSYFEVQTGLDESKDKGKGNIVLKTESFLVAR